jgi:4-hydroxyphenylpyruvate dioxygenase-like putative hemolysin
MGWVIHNGRRYYYRKVCNGHRVRAVYVGAGPVAEAIAVEDAQRAAARRAAIARHAAQRALADEVEAGAAPVADLVEALLVASLLTTGHHYDDHFEWKRLREK